MNGVRSWWWLCLLAGASGGLLLPACGQGSAPAPGALVGKYAVRGVLVENTCGSGLSPVNPLEFVVQLREDDGIGYWAQGKSAQQAGSMADDGAFRFSVSQTKVVSQSSPGQNLEPGDFLRSADSNFDLAQSMCALTINETIAGNLARWNELAGAVVSASDAGTDDDMSATDTITVTPTAGSNCNPVLAAYGGSYTALPCQAIYKLRGTLDTSEVPSAQSRVGGAGGSRAGASGANSADSDDAGVAP